MRPSSTSISALFCPRYATILNSLLSGEPRVPRSESLRLAITSIGSAFYAQLQALHKLFVSMF